MTSTAILRSARAGLDSRAVKRDFPAFDNNPGLVFLDTAASAPTANSRRAVRTAGIIRCITGTSAFNVCPEDTKPRLFEE